MGDESNCGGFVHHWRTFTEFSKRTFLAKLKCPHHQNLRDSTLTGAAYVRLRALVPGGWSATRRLSRRGSRKSARRRTRITRTRRGRFRQTLPRVWPQDSKAQTTRYDRFGMKRPSTPESSRT